MKSIKYLIILLLSLFALESNAQGYKIILKDGRTATVRADETELITFSKSVTTKAGSVPGYKIILSSGKNLIIGTEETEIFTFTTDINLKTNISAFEEIAVSSITLSASSLSMIEGEVATLTADIQPNNALDKTITWTSDNPNVVTVDDKGLVTAKAPGTATISVSAADGSGVSANCSVIVSPAIINVTGISLCSTSLSMIEGNTASLTATVTPSDATNKDITWTSNNTNVAKVSDSGLVTAISAGSATITATAADGSGLSAACKVYVESAIVYVSSVSLSNTSVSLTEGDTKYLTYSISPSNATNKEVTWSSSNTSVATVDAFGMITAKSAGSATITAKANDGSGVKATCNVSVQSATVYVSSITLNSSSLSMTEGDTQYLSVSVYPSNATNKSVTWSSSNTSVATVNSSGMVTAKAAGSTIITVKANDGSGVKATCSVSVKASVPDKSPSGAKAVDLGLSVKWANMNIGATSITSSCGYFAWGETSDRNTAYNKYNYKYYGKITTLNFDGSAVEVYGYSKYILQSQAGGNGYDRLYDNKNTLDIDDDAAFQNWGGKWRMPTKDEFQELIDKCEWTMMTLDNKDGYKVTAPNGNYIFLPVDCYKGGDTFWGGSSIYWSSTLTDYSCNEAYFLYIYKSGSYYMRPDERYWGGYIRAVCP